MDQPTNTGQQPDPAPGFYYVSVINGDRHVLLSGPFKWHQSALDEVSTCRRVAKQVDPRAVFYAFGTCRTSTNAGPGILNKRGLVAAIDRTEPDWNIEEQGELAHA